MSLCKRPPSELEVVGGHEESTGQDERYEQRRDDDRPGDADRDRADAGRRRRARSACVRVSFVLSGRPCSSSSAWALMPTARKNAARAAARRFGVNVGRGRRPERHVAQMPGGVRRVKQRDQVAPAARTQRVERRAVELTRGARHAAPDSRHHEARAEAHAALADLARSRLVATGCEVGLGGVEMPRCSGRGSGRPRTTPVTRRGRAAAGRRACGRARRREAAALAGTPNSTIPIRPPGLTTRASSRIVAARSST